MLSNKGDDKLRGTIDSKMWSTELCWGGVWIGMGEEPSLGRFGEAFTMLIITQVPTKWVCERGNLTWYLQRGLTNGKVI